MTAKLKRMFGATQAQSAFQLSSTVRTVPSQIQLSGTVRERAYPMRKKKVGAARRPTTLHQRASSTKKYPKCPMETKMIAAVFSQSVSSTGGDTLCEPVAWSPLRGTPLSFLSRVTVLRRRRGVHRAGK